VVHRDDAHWYFNLTEAMSCKWLSCYVERYDAAWRHISKLQEREIFGILPPSQNLSLRTALRRYRKAMMRAQCTYNEHLLVDWLIWHKLSVSALGSASAGPSLWERPTTAGRLRMRVSGLVTSERGKAANCEGQTLSDAHKWLAPAYNNGLSVSQACTEMLGGRLLRPAV